MKNLFQALMVRRGKFKLFDSHLHIQDKRGYLHNYGSGTKYKGSSFYNPYTKMIGCLSVCLCVPKDLANQ